MKRLVRAWLLTAISDGLFASVLTVVFFHSTLARLWQGVASTLLGKAAFDGGTRTALIGVLMHFGVALFWSVVFLFLYNRSPAIRRVAATRNGVLKIAAIYGPFIWLFMSIIVIPLLLHRPPLINNRWWIQLIGHIPFVAVPMVWSITRGESGASALSA